jgi:hypothetical protein
VNLKPVVPGDPKIWKGFQVLCVCFATGWAFGSVGEALLAAFGRARLGEHQEGGAAFFGPHGGRGIRPVVRCCTHPATVAIYRQLSTVSSLGTLFL